MITIGLVGATNVGKSTLFNRLIGQFRAIVTDIPGTTVDIIRHEYHHATLGTIEFADSPGLMTFEEERGYIKSILDDSSVILFLVDAIVGISAKEQKIHDYIQHHDLSSKVVLVVNKLDKDMSDNDYHTELADFYALGYMDTVGVSAKNSKNISLIWPILEAKIAQGIEAGDLDFQKTKKTHIQLAILGKPNSGKSTLLNTLAKSQISKVEDRSGTTLDYINTVINLDGHNYEIIDTAGIKKKARTHGLEKIAYEKTIGMIKYIRPIVIYMLDITEGLSHRDMTLIEEIHNKALPIILAVNKTDTVEKNKYKEYVEGLSKRFEFARYIPILPISGINGKGVGNLFKMIRAVHKESRIEIGTGELNKVIMKAYISRPPRFPKNKICKILYMTQVNANPPRFIVFVNHKSRANFSFKRWLENTIRQEYGFIGCPLVFEYRQREQKKHGEHDADYEDKLESRNEKFESNLRARISKDEEKEDEFDEFDQEDFDYDKYQNENFAPVTDNGDEETIVDPYKKPKKAKASSRRAVVETKKKSSSRGMRTYRDRPDEDKKSPKKVKKVFKEKIVSSEPKTGMKPVKRTIKKPIKTKESNKIIKKNKSEK